MKRMSAKFEIMAAVFAAGSGALCVYVGWKASNSFDWPFFPAWCAFCVVIAVALWRLMSDLLKKT